MKNSVVGIFSICFGLAGFFLAYWYIGIIPCIIAIILAVIGLMDYLAYKWSSVIGLICAGFGILLFTYTTVTDIRDGNLIIAYNRGDSVYVSNADNGSEALDEFAKILIKAEAKAEQEAEEDDEQTGSSVISATNEEQQNISDEGDAGENNTEDNPQ